MAQKVFFLDNHFSAAIAYLSHSPMSGNVTVVVTNSVTAPATATLSNTNTDNDTITNTASGK